LLHLLGIDTKDYVQFGTDLLSEQHNDVIPFRNGEFVSSTITYTNGIYYDSITGLKLDEDIIAEAKKYGEISERKLALSDKVVNGDLLRFYTPKTFTPVDRLRFDYNTMVNK
jgi:lipoteichoic acid synthase